MRNFQLQKRKMMLERVNLKEKLLRERERAQGEAALLDEVKSILAANETERENIRTRLRGDEAIRANGFIFDLLDTGRIFHVSQIREVCIDYRLRFLDSRLFKSEIPEEAVSAVRLLEKKHGIAVAGFKIMAPSKQFHLKNYDDPLLFAPIGNGYYYLIHKWGNDLSPLRKLMVLPMRNFGTLLAFLAMVSLLFSLLIVNNPFNKVSNDLFILMSFLFTFKGVCGVALYYCFWRGKNFNYAIWDSEFYNK